MTYEAARPRYALKLADQEYELIGTFELIEACEYALKESIIQIAKRIVDMGVADTAKLIAAMLRVGGGKSSTYEIADVLYNGMGINSEEFAELKMHLYAFFKIILAPQSKREAAAKEMGELIGKLETTASRGKNTKASA